jgi:hypothetical protein
MMFRQKMLKVIHVVYLHAEKIDWKEFYKMHRLACNLLLMMHFVLRNYLNS